jgi:hypothetical protein
VFDFNERSILTKSVIKSSESAGWNGASEQSTNLRTFNLELPRGEVTVKCGKIFEVRYFLNISTGTSTKPWMVTVQLPIVLIHMNSLDVVPNSVAQVAAAMEEKEVRSQQASRLAAVSAVSAAAEAAAAAAMRSPHRRCGSSANAAAIQGRAFAAPRKQSQDRAHVEYKNLVTLGCILDSSPRKYCAAPAPLPPPPPPPEHAQHDELSWLRRRHASIARSIRCCLPRCRRSRRSRRTSSCSPSGRIQDSWAVAYSRSWD